MVVEEVVEVESRIQVAAFSRCHPQKKYVPTILFPCITQRKSQLTGFPGAM